MKFSQILVIVFAFAGCKNLSETNTSTLKVVDMRIYNDFERKGYTTSGAFNHFDELKSSGTKIQNVATSDKERLSHIINNAEKSKHHQKKLGTDIVFSLVNFGGNDVKLIIEVAGDRSFLTDLDASNDYIVANQDDVEWLKLFIAKIKQI